MAFNARTGKDPVQNQAQRDLVDESLRLAGALDSERIIVFRGNFQAKPSDRALTFTGGVASTLVLASARVIGVGRSGLLRLSNRGAATLTIAAQFGETTNLPALAAGGGAVLFSDGVGWKGVS